jgi:uncharacterized protein
MFFAITFAWTWALWGIAASIRAQAPGWSSVLVLASAFGPGLAAVFVTLVFEGVIGLRQWLRRCLVLRVNWRWYALAALIPPLIMLAALAIQAALGGAIPAFPYADRVLVAVAQFPLILVFGGPLGEEFGWRGYALPALSARMGWRWASVFIGAAWAVWHVPLFFIAGTAQAGLPMALFVASTIGLSVVMARLAVNTGFSVVPAILLHSVINWCSMVVPIMPQGGDTQAYSLVAGIAILVALGTLLKPGPKAASYADVTPSPPSNDRAVPSRTS